MAGKHEANSTGKHAEGGGKGRVLLLGLLAVILAGYVGLCAWVNHSDAVFSNVSVAGIDVSGMSRSEAREAVAQAVSQKAEQATLKLTHGSWSTQVRASDLANDGYFEEELAVDAYLAGKDNFLTYGFQYLRHLLGGGSTVELTLNYDRVEQPALDAILAQAQKELGSDSIMATYVIEGENLVMTKGRTDVSIDKGETAMAVYNAFEDEVFPALFRGEDPDVTVEMVVGEVPAQPPEFELLHHTLYAEVAEPTYDKETKTVTDHVVGVDFDVNALKSAYEAAAEGETFSIPLILTQPKDTKETYQKKLFANVLGTATSKVSGSTNRKSNVKLSAQACNGVILLPGEVFSYNNTTGSRSPDKGYLPAPTYNAGASVDDVGGGICQTSSTIYYALLHTTLEVVERQNHSYATGYVPDGMDATVFFGSLDFRFKNNTNYPVKVVTESYDKNGSRYLKVTLVGTNENGRYAKPTNSVYEVVEPSKSYVADETVPQGTLVLDKQQNAYRGRKAQVTRTIYESDGTVVEKQNMGVSRYKMRPHLYHYNPLDGDPATWPDGVPPKPVPVTPVVPEPPAETTQPTVPEVPAESTQPTVPEVPAETTQPTAPAEPAPETQTVPA